MIKTNYADLWWVLSRLNHTKMYDVLSRTLIPVTKLMNWRTMIAWCLFFCATLNVVKYEIKKGVGNSIKLVYNYLSWQGKDWTIGWGCSYKYVFNLPFLFLQCTPVKLCMDLSHWKEIAVAVIIQFVNVLSKSKCNSLSKKAHTRIDDIERNLCSSPGLTLLRREDHLEPVVSCPDSFWIYLRERNSTTYPGNLC